MRSRNEIPHDKIKYYPDLLKQAGYHTSNPGKTDYNIGGREDKACWDYGGGKVKGKRKTQYGWRERKPGQPFFAIVNLTESHESKAHGSLDGLTKDPAAMKLFSYHPDLPEIRQNYAKYAIAVEKMDSRVQAALDALKADGLEEDTIVIYNSDHGGVMPRSKRFCYASGIHCPLIVRVPEKLKHLYPADQPGSTVDRIVSFVDMPKTWLSLAGADIPESFQGTIFLGEATEPEPKYHLAFRERADERLDHVRVVRGKRFAYHKNYMPYAPAGQHLAYLWKAKAMPAWEQHHREGKTNDVTGRFFRPRVSEEFYDNDADFDNVNNLIADPSHREKISELKAALRTRQLKLYDSGLLPEKMRERRAAANQMTIYEMVRNKTIYPLEEYLDAADMALSREKSNVDTLIDQMSDSDEGMRWWAVVGLHLLEKEAEGAKAILHKALSDQSHEVRIMAAWTLIKLGDTLDPMKCLDTLLFEKPTAASNATMLHNVLDWMGESAYPLVKKFSQNNGEKNGKYGTSVLGRIAEINGW